MGQTFPPHPEICMVCRHYEGVEYIETEPDLEGDHINVCKAFPEGIPEEILLGEHKHRRPFKGDNGIRFAPKRK